MVDKLEYVYDDGEVLYLSDGNQYYGLNYESIDKAELRDYADVEPTEVEKDEDGDLSYYYDDDSWEVDYEILEEYIKDYIKYGYEIYESGEAPETIDGAIFKVHENDNGWYETLIEYLKLEKNERNN
jgi:hypothetical protein